MNFYAFFNCIIRVKMFRIINISYISDEKMQKNKFCLNFYTAGRNTKIIKTPDYKNYKSVSLPFTAPNDGYICGGVYSLGTTACYIYINNTQVGWNHSGGGSNTASPFMYPLSKGDIVTAIGYDLVRALFIYTK